MIGVSIFGIIVGSLISVGILVMLLRKMAKSSGADKDELITQYKQHDRELRYLAQFSNSYVSKDKFAKLIKMIEEMQNQLTTEKSALVETEKKLEVAQQSVEEKEAAQQELKSSKEEDEKKLENLLSNCSKISNESVELEQTLAESLKNLDNMLNELELTADQKAVMEEFSKALSSAGGILRDLITEHSSLMDRLNALRRQHEDLEDEYTRLVEQQLGE